MGGPVAHGLLEAEAEEPVPVVVEEVPVHGDDLVAAPLGDVPLVVDRERAEATHDDLVARLAAQALVDPDLPLGREHLDARAKLLGALRRLVEPELAILRAEEPVEVLARVLRPERLVDHEREEVRAHDGRVPVEVGRDLVPELARVLLVARLDRDRLVVRADDVARRVDRAPARVDRDSVPPHGVPERVERLAERDVDPRVELEDPLDERVDPRRLAELVVHDDVARLARLLEEVVHQGLGLEDELGADRDGDHVDVRLLAAPAEVVDVGAQAAAEEPELELALDRSGAAARPSGEEQVVVAVLERDGRVLLEDVLVDLGRLAPVHLVGAEVVHEVRDEPVREQVETRAVGEGREALVVEGVAQDDRVQVRDVGRTDDERAPVLELARLVHHAVHDEAITDRRHLGEGPREARRREGVEEPREREGEGLRRDAVHLGVEVPEDLAREVLGDLGEEGLLLLDARLLEERAAPVVPPRQRGVAALGAPLLVEAAALLVDRVGDRGIEPADVARPGDDPGDDLGDRPLLVFGSHDRNL